MAAPRLGFVLSSSCVLWRRATQPLWCLQEGSSGYVGADVSANALTLSHCFAFYAMHGRYCNVLHLLFLAVSGLCAT